MSWLAGVTTLVRGPESGRMPVPADRTARDHVLAGIEVVIAWTTGETASEAPAGDGAAAMPRRPAARRLGATIRAPALRRLRVGATSTSSFDRLSRWRSTTSSCTLRVPQDYRGRLDFWVHHRE